MAIFSFFKKPVHQKFDYKPRYYDPVKEDLEARLAAHREGGGSSEQVKSRISSGFRRKSRSSSTVNRRSNIRLIAILVALVAMTFIFLNTYLPAIIQAVE